MITVTIGMMKRRIEMMMERRKIVRMKLMHVTLRAQHRRLRHRRQGMAVTMGMMLSHHIVVMAMMRMGVGMVMTIVMIEVRHMLGWMSQCLM